MNATAPAVGSHSAAFFAASRTAPFGGSLSQSQVDGINALLNAWASLGDGDNRKLAYVLATTFHETAQTMQPIYEEGSRDYFNKYEPGTPLGKELGNTIRGDGFLFRGRGFVQLTGRANYLKAGRALALDLAGTPDLALELSVAARVAFRGMTEGWFTGKKLGDYFTPTACDYLDARRIINGTDQAGKIAVYAKQFDVALTTA